MDPRGSSVVHGGLVQLRRTRARPPRLGLGEHLVRPHAIRGTPRLHPFLARRQGLAASLPGANGSGSLEGLAETQQLMDGYGLRRGLVGVGLRSLRLDHVGRDSLGFRDCRNAHRHRHRPFPQRPGRPTRRRDHRRHHRRLGRHPNRERIVQREDPVPPHRRLAGVPAGRQRGPVHQRLRPVAPRGHAVAAYLRPPRGWMPLASLTNPRSEVASNRGRSPLGRRDQPLRAMAHPRAALGGHSRPVRHSRMAPRRMATCPAVGGVHLLRGLHR